MVAWQGAQPRKMCPWFTPVDAGAMGKAEGPKIRSSHEVFIFVEGRSHV